MVIIQVLNEITKHFDLPKGEGLMTKIEIHAQFKKEQFENAVKIVVGNLGVSTGRAKQIVLDLCKEIIESEKDPASLEHEARTLDYSRWSFLRKKRTQQVVRGEF